MERRGKEKIEWFPLPVVSSSTETVLFQYACSLITANKSICIVQSSGGSWEPTENKPNLLLSICQIFYHDTRLMKLLWFPGDLGVNSGEELQLTTTITHVDGPTEVYKLSRKEAQE